MRGLRTTTTISHAWGDLARLNSQRNLEKAYVATVI